MKIQKLTILSIVCLLFAAVANAHITSSNATNIFWTGAGDGISWMDTNNWYEEPHWNQESRSYTTNYGIPGWWEDNPYDPEWLWNVNGNKGYAVFNGGGTVTINNLPTGRIERIFIGGPTNTTVSFETYMGPALANCYRLYVGCAGDIGTLNIPVGGEIIDPEATTHYVGWGGTGTINITGGTLQIQASGTSDKNLYVGWGPGGVGTVNLSSGSYTLNANPYGITYLGRRYATGNFIQTGGTANLYRMILAADAKVVGDEKSHGLCEISGGTFHLDGNLLMNDGGEGILRVIGSSPVVQMQKLDMIAGYGHKLEFVLDSSGVSAIEVFGKKATGSGDEGANIRGEVVLSAQAGVTVNVNDTFDVLQSATYINTDAMTIRSLIPNIDFTASVVQVADANVLRLTAVAAAPECGDVLHPYPEMDFTGPDGNRDCSVNFYDFAMFADAWAEDNNP